MAPVCALPSSQSHPRLWLRPSPPTSQGERLRGGEGAGCYQHSSAPSWAGLFPPPHLSRGLHKGPWLGAKGATDVLPCFPPNQQLPAASVVVLGLPTPLGGRHLLRPGCQFSKARAAPRPAREPRAAVTVHPDAFRERHAPTSAQVPLATPQPQLPPRLAPPTPESQVLVAGAGTTLRSCTESWGRSQT